MSNCGKCASKNCSCFLIDDGATTLVKGIGTSYSPFQVRPRTPADFRPVAYLDRTTVQSITLNTDTAISFDRSRTQGFHDGWDPVPNPSRLNIFTAGVYLIGGFASQAGTGTSQIWHVWIAKNGVAATPLVKRTTTSVASSINIYCSVMTLVKLNAGDYLELYVRSTRTANTGSTFDPYPNLWANWMAA